MKALLFIICVVLYVVEGKGRCGCSCNYTINGVNSIVYIGSAGGADSKAECSELNPLTKKTACAYKFSTASACRIQGGVFGEYSGQFGIFDGDWEIIPSRNVGCDSCCFKGNVSLTDKMIGFGSWFYEGTAEYISTGCGSTGKIVTLTGGPLPGYQNTPIFEANSKFTFNYDESIGRMTISFRGSSPKTQQAYCKSGACLNNTNVDITGSGPASSGVSKIMSNAMGLALSTLVVVAFLKR